MEEKNVTTLTTDELLRELVYCNKMKALWYKRTDEVMKEIERRQENGRDNIN